MSTPKPVQPDAFTATGSFAAATDRKRVVFATVVGTTVEWYDFFIYASAAGLVFGQLFFEPAGPQAEGREEVTHSLPHRHPELVSGSMSRHGRSHRSQAQANRKEAFQAPASRSAARWTLKQVQGDDEGDGW